MADEKKVEKAKKADTKKAKDKKAKKNPFKSIAAYFKSVGKEGKKVIWPKANEVLRNTVVVLFVILIVGVVIYVVDLGLTQGMKGIKNLANTTSTTAAGQSETTQALEETTQADNTTTTTTASSTKAAE